ncbi:hypothetical protein I4U23_001156 [Adineta vaga]|nr:hypothetical protein I4U23_001156 [Adineta vaga]
MFQLELYALTGIKVWHSAQSKHLVNLIYRSTTPSTNYMKNSHITLNRSGNDNVSIAIPAHHFHCFNTAKFFSENISV